MAMLTVFMVVVMTPVFVNIVSNMEQITLDLKVCHRPPRSTPSRPDAAPPPHAVLGRIKSSTSASPT